MPEVPPRPAQWPPDEFQLSTLVYGMHWDLEELAFDLPRGAADRERLDATARRLETLAHLLRTHVTREQPLTQSGHDKGGLHDPDA